MIDYVYANNYKSFVNFRMDFNNLNLILGKNGSGKSNAVDLIFSLLSLINGNNDAMANFFSNATLTRWMKSNIQVFELGLSDDEHKYVYHVEIEQHELAVGYIISEKITCDDLIMYRMSDGNAILYDDEWNGTPVLTDNSVSGVSFAPTDDKHTYLAKFKRLTLDISLCRPDPKAMVDIAQAEEYGTKVNFSNIASAFANLMQTDPEMYTELIQTLKEIDPSLSKFKIAMTPMGRILTVEYKHKDVICTYRFSELSDGEKMLFALYILLFGYVKKGYTVLIDEPDNYLSLREIQPWCKAVEEEVFEHGQCIMISHNSEIIDYFAAQNGIWLNRLSSGESVVGEDIYKKLDNEKCLKYSEIIARGIIDEAE